jgi:hypothetical protein
MELQRHLDSLVPFLAQLKRDSAAEVFFDMMSGALVWTDEKVTGVTPEQMGSLRAILRFRTSMILDQPDPRFQRLWERFEKICPYWIGFDRSRCESSEGLVRTYRELKRH